MKEILSKQRKVGYCYTISLTQGCNAIVDQKLSPKLKDPSTFYIPCTTREHHFGKVLFDLGARIKLMPFSIFKTLGLGEVQLTSVTLQMADRSLKKIGVIVDILPKVDKFFFPVDFFIFDMKKRTSLLFQVILSQLQEGL